VGVTVPAVPLAGLTDSLRAFVDALQAFLSSLAAVSWAPLSAGLLLHGAFLTLGSRAWFNVLRAAYPAERFRWRNLWAAYLVGMGVNSVVPARPGALAKLFLAKQSVPNSSYPAIVSSVLVEALFMAATAALVIVYAMTQGVFPELPDLPRLAVFDLGFLARHPDFALFAVTAVAVLVLTVIAILSVRVKAFWARTRQGLTILGQRSRYVRQVLLFQVAGWVARFAAFWLLLEAFHIEPSVRNVLLVLAVQGLSGLVPFTPGGAGAQQALLVVVLGGVATGTVVAAYSVGQQLSIAAFNFVVGLLALALVFRTTDWRSLVRRGREERGAARAGAG
jgi:uncharacterized membrane protein YbhN (UPF0104 family)